MTIAQPSRYGLEIKVTMSSAVQFSSLGNPIHFKELGAGGEGRVFAIPGRADVVYKEFLDISTTSPGLQALERLIEVRDSWTVDETSWMTERSVWPQVAVMHGARLRGFLMARIPTNFYRKHGIRTNPRVVPCEWNYLALRDRFRTNPNIFSEVPNPDVFGVIELLLDLAKTIELLHQHQIVLGDLSGRNLLWTDRPSYRVLVIDNDGFRFIGTGGIASPKQSPDWDDPFLRGQPTSTASDVYKLGLAAYRSIASAGTERPSRSSMNNPRLVQAGGEIVDLILASTDSNDRPSAADWVVSLSTIVAYRGRPAVDLSLGSPAQSIPPTRSSRIERDPRPVIQVRTGPAQP